MVGGLSRLFFLSSRKGHSPAGPLLLFRWFLPREGHSPAGPLLLFRWILPREGHSPAGPLLLFRRLVSVAPTARLFQMLGGLRAASIWPEPRATQIPDSPWFLPLRFLVFASVVTLASDSFSLAQVPRRLF